MKDIKQKKLVVLKTVLLTSISATVGYDFYINLLVGTDYGSFYSSLYSFFSSWGIDDLEVVKNIGYFIKGVPYYFFLFLFVALSEWILFSEELPSKWLFSSFCGALLAGLLESTSHHLIFIPRYPLMELWVDLLNGCFLVGLLATIPQWLLFRKRWKSESYYWLVINMLGWGIVGYFLKQELAISYTFGFGKFWVSIFDWIRYYRLWYIVDFCSFIPLGLGIGLFLTKISVNKLTDKNNINSNESASPVESVRAENVKA